MVWELIKVNKTEWKPDDSGYYTLIHYISGITVRLDIMDRDDMPVISFQGTADNVRKHVMQHISAYSTSIRLISVEHASYIGAELARCALLQSKYIQD